MGITPRIVVADLEILKEIMTKMSDRVVLVQIIV